MTMTIQEFEAQLTKLLNDSRLTPAEVVGVLSLILFNTQYGTALEAQRFQAQRGKEGVNHAG
jgi:hypothetical protein